MKKRLGLSIFVFLLFTKGFAGELKAGQRYKIIKTAYLIAEYNDRGNKSVSKETAKAYLESSPRAKMTYTAFQTEVPIGTVMTIVSQAPKPWYLYFQGDIYIIRLEPDLSRGLGINVQLDRGIEGTLDGLNPALFSPL